VWYLLFLSCVYMYLKMQNPSLVNWEANQQTASHDHWTIIAVRNGASSLNKSLVAGSKCFCKTHASKAPQTISNDAFWKHAALNLLLGISLIDTLHTWLFCCYAVRLFYDKQFVIIWCHLLCATRSYFSFWSWCTYKIVEFLQTCLEILDLH
jgi:hypothetical protein